MESILENARLAEHGERTLVNMSGSKSGSREPKLAAIHEESDGDSEKETRLAYIRREPFQPDYNRRKDDRAYPRRDRRDKEYRDSSRKEERGRREDRDHEPGKADNAVKSAPLRPPRPPRPQWQRGPQKDDTKVQVRAGRAESSTEETKPALANMDTEEGYRSEYTVEDDAQSETADAIESERCGMLFALAVSEEDDCPELLDVEDSDVEAEDGHDLAAEDSAFDDSELDLFSRRIAEHMQSSQSLEASLVHFGAIRRDDDLETPGVGSRQRKVWLAKSTSPQVRPTKADNRCLTAFVKINGHEAFTLFDTGCTTEALSPDFARVSGMKVFPLTNQVPLQLGTSGSRSKINHGVRAQVEMGPLRTSEYFDIVNLDRYDAIVGMPFMRKHSVSLFPAANRITQAGREIPTLTASQERETIARRSAARAADTP
ncbi:Retrovirus-related Pol polyprotein from transposon 412 [Mycena kentingensis (nom. inval.)]|nr:Retrovirus-related Pol polyprotein from transposon 412 [Mycena kentingensis (nom. inval.)]